MAQRTSVVIYTISTSTQWVSLSQTDPNKMGDRKYHLTDGDKFYRSWPRKPAGARFSLITSMTSINRFRTLVTN